MVQITKYICNKTDNLNNKMNNPKGKLAKGYFHTVTLSVLIGAGVTIAGASILAFLASAGHLSALVTFLHVGGTPSHTMMIASVTGMAAGSTIAISHGALLAIKRHGKGDRTRGYSSI